MSDSAGEFVIAGGSEGDALGQMKLPSLLKGQVGLFCIWNHLAILQQVNCNVWGVEVTHVADQCVLFAKLTRVTTVNLDFWWS